jgi:hypothetical protein
MFSDNKRCELCGKKSDVLTEVTKKSIKENGTFKTKVCTDCLLDVMDEHLRTFGGRAVIIDPASKVGYSRPKAYLYSPVFHLKDSNYPMSEIQTVFEKLPKEDTSCKSCSTKKAQYTWLPADFLNINNSNDYGNSLRTQTFRKDVIGEHLCSGCTSSKFKESMKQYQRKFDVVEPPIGRADGLISLKYS